MDTASPAKCNFSIARDPVAAGEISKNALTSTCIPTYQLEHGEIGHRFADALIAKQSLGIRADLIRNRVRTLGKPGDFLARLTKVGTMVLEFTPINPDIGIVQ